MAPFSKPEAKAYALATMDWRELPRSVDARTLRALVGRGSVETRIRQGEERGQLMVAEWRRVPRSGA